MLAPDRRTFLRTASRLAAGVALFDAGWLSATSRPPMSNPNDPLKPLDGTGILELPAGATRRLGTTAMRIPGNVNALQFSPKGTTLVSATSGELRGWDPRTGKVLFRLPFPADASTDSGRLTSRDTFVLMVRPHSGGNFEFRQYAFGTGKLVSRSPAVHIENSQRGSFSVDGSLAAIVHNAALCIYDTATAKEKWRESLPPEAVSDSTFFHDGSTVALASKGGVKLFATATGKLAGTLHAGADVAGDKKEGRGERDRDHVSDLSVSADGKWLAASVGEDEDVVLCWDVKAGAVKHQYKPARKPLGFMPDGSELATIYRGVVTFWTMAAGKAARSFAVPSGDVHLSPDGKMLAADGGDVAILVDSITGKHLPHSADPPGVPSDLRFVGPDRLQGRLNPWGGWVEWDLKSGSQVLIHPPGVNGQTPVSLTTDGKMALYRRDGEYTAFAMGTGNPLRSVKLADDENESLTTLAMTPDGRAFVTVAEDGLAVVTDQGRRVIPRTGDAPGQAIVVATDGRTAAVGYRGGDGGARLDLYDLVDNRYLRSLMLDGDPGQVTFSSDGARVAVGHDVGRDFRRGQQSATTLFDLRTGKVVFQARGEEDDFGNALALSLDGRMLARLGSEGRVRISEVHARDVRTVLTVGKDADVQALAFSPGGRTLAISANGGPVFMWDLYAGPPLALAAEDLECAWQVLETGDATAAFKAVRLLVRASSQAVAFLRSRIAPLLLPDPKVVDQHLANLDHKEYRKREMAFRSLAALGERVREHLTRAVATKPAPEVRERLERLLASEERPAPDLLRRLRAVEAVEMIGTPEAQSVLRAWAAGAPGALFTTEAAAAAQRVAARAG